jgi:hypothetical protein
LGHDLEIVDVRSLNKEGAAYQKGAKVKSISYVAKGVAGGAAMIGPEDL